MQQCGIRSYFMYVPLSTPNFVSANFEDTGESVKLHVGSPRPALLGNAISINRHMLAH